MRNSDSPYLADLFVISLRWLVLFGLTISLGVGGILAQQNESGAQLTIILLTLPALWNGFVSSLAIFNRRLVQHRLINLGLDILFSMMLFVASGGLRSGIFWVALLPLFSAAIYFEARGALITAVLISLLQAGYIYLSALLFAGQRLQALPLEIITGFNFGAGVVVSLLSYPVIRQLRRTYQTNMNKRKESERKVQALEHDRMKALFAMIETFSATLNYQTVLDTMLATAIDALGDFTDNREGMVGCVLLFGDRRELELRAARGFLSSDSTVVLPGDQGALHQAFSKGETYLIDLPFEDPELGKLTTLQDQKVALLLPLIRSMNAYGVMLFAHPNPNFFIQERIETLQMLSNQAVIALQNARLYQDLAREKERIVQTQEEAQKKLARDLHDGPTQSVSAIAMRINIARKMMERSPGEAGMKEAADELIRIEDLARRTTQEIRHMLFTLRPLVLESEGLQAALVAMSEKMRELYQQNVIIDLDAGMVNQMDSMRQTVAFYLVEEALNNARKHAEATEIWVRIRPAPADSCVAVLEIADNGKGFDVKTIMNSYDRRGSLGMINLHERTELVNGLLKIDSIPGKGTRIRAFIPLNEEAADRLHNHNHR